MMVFTFGREVESSVPQRSAADALRELFPHIPDAPAE